MYDSGLHTHTYGHATARTCATCKGRWTPADLSKSASDRKYPTPRAPKRDEWIGATVVASVARTPHFDKVSNIIGQVWSQADPTMIGSRREHAYWIADGTSYYAAAESDLRLSRCALEWPSAAHGGMWDERCPNPGTEWVDGAPACESCAAELTS